MKKKYTLKVFPAGNGREVYRVIEISGEHSLDDLCGVILSSFDFIDEHLYEFCMDNRMYSDYSYQSDPESGEPSTKAKLGKIGLMAKQKFLLHYNMINSFVILDRFSLPLGEMYSKSSILIPNLSGIYMPGSMDVTLPTV